MADGKRMRSASTAVLAAFPFALAVTLGATRWLPAGPGGVDHVVLPAVLFPVVWVVFALYLYAARRRRQAWTVIAAISTLHALLAAYGFFA